MSQDRQTDLPNSSGEEEARSEFTTTIETTDTGRLQVTGPDNENTVYASIEGDVNALYLPIDENRYLEANLTIGSDASIQNGFLRVVEGNGISEEVTTNKDGAADYVGNLFHGNITTDSEDICTQKTFSLIPESDAVQPLPDISRVEIWNPDASQDGVDHEFLSVSRPDDKPNSPDVSVTYYTDSTSGAITKVEYTLSYQRHTDRVGDQMSGLAGDYLNSGFNTNRGSRHKTTCLELIR